MMKPSETVFAPAKLNLFLHVTGRRDDGLHTLQSLFVFLNIGDRLDFFEAAEDDLRMSPDLGVPREKNLAWKALEGVRNRFPGLPRRQIHIEKTLPAEAGIGGGTADAAAVVHWAESLAPNVEFRSALATLGADMPPAMDQTARLWTGTGDEPGMAVSGLSGTPVLLLKPSTGVSTGACFAALQGQFSPTFDFDPAGDLKRQLRRARNDLEAPARSLNLDIEDALSVLESLEGAWLVRMTGSGSTCFAIFNEKGPRDAALDAVRQSHPTWWSMSAEII